MDRQRADSFAKIVHQRRSIRSFLPEPIPAPELQAIFALAQQAPSNCNTQPWLSYVVSGPKLEVLREKLPAAMASGQFSMDFPYAGQYEGVYKERQYGAARALYAALDIAREDKAGRNAAFMQNYRFYGAPHVLFLFMPEFCGLREAADCGMYAQNLMLALTAYGYGSCPQTALSFNADLVREELGIPAAQKLLFGISFGRIDSQHPANTCRTERSDVAGAVQFIE